MRGDCPRYSLRFGGLWGVGRLPSVKVRGSWFGVVRRGRAGDVDRADRLSAVQAADVGAGAAHVLHALAGRGGLGRKRTGGPESCFALVLALKCFQKTARFPSPDEIPEVVIDHVRRCLELPDDVWPDHGSARSARRIASWCASARA